ncbi:MAG: GntR family transcriptional regulator [Terriglobia bacterium]|jgi:GntR family transcriptional regulator|nr:GntR family transcriptional regulator [Terriglobia bacterium]
MSSHTLDRQSVVPLYYQIRQSLLDQIRSEELKPGDAVPSEQAISAQFGVSRMTVRQALKSLADLGVIYSRRGKGTFVAGHKLEKSFRQVLSFTEEMAARGARASSRVLRFRVEPADQTVADVLHVPEGEKLVSLKRLRLADSVPMGIEWSRIPQKLCPDLRDTFDPRSSLYQLLSQRYGIKVAVTDEVAEAGVADPEQSRLLQIPRRSPVLLFSRISYVESGKPVEYVVSVYRGDRYKIVNRLITQK